MGPRPSFQTKSTEHAMSDTQTSNSPSTEIPQVVKAGEFFTLGWSYYDTRLHVLQVLQDFNLYEKLREYWERTRSREEPEHHTDLDEGYVEFVKDLSDAGLVKDIQPVIEVVPPCSTGSTQVSELFTVEVCAEESR